MELTEADDAELPAVANLMNLAYRGGGPVQGWCTEADYIEGARTSAAQLAEDRAARPGARLLLHHEAGAVVASVWLEPIRNGVWYLGGLAVEPSLQDRRLGRRLLEAAEARARKEGACTIRITVVNVRETLIAWYLRRAYRLTGKVEPWPYEDPRFGTPRRPDLSFVVLEKALAAPADGQSPSRSG